MRGLTIDHLVWRYQFASPGAEIVGIRGDPGDETTTSRQSAAQAAVRIRGLAAGLQTHFGAGKESTVAVAAFNTREHFELVLAVPLIGASVNSLNVRLQPEVLFEQALKPTPAAVIIDSEMIAHAMVGSTVTQLITRLGEAGVPVVIIGDPSGTGASDHDLLNYESLIVDAEDHTFPHIDENHTAYLFHSSGTTGPPKTYKVSHRAAVLHALSQATTEATGLSHRDKVLPLAPFFHVNGWGLPLTSAFTGSSLIFCGGNLDAHRIAAVMRDEEVTVATGVPTIWYDVCTAVEADPSLQPRDLREVLSGGSAVPRPVESSVRNVLGATVTAAWGMTETLACSTYERHDPSTSAGYPVPLIEIRIDEASGPPVTDGQKHRGLLEVSGPFVVGAERSSNEWFDTGDIASIDSSGRLRLHDREKDLIKSGGEWIVSAELEQHLCTHPEVVTAAVVATPHPRWVERPQAYVVVLGQTTAPDLEADLRIHILQRFPRWWLPDQIIICDSLPRTGVGKIDKARLRRQSVPAPTAP